jgi:predicted transcriptional regulator
MAEWHVSDELDARLRAHVDGDVNEYVEQIITEQLDYEEDPAYRAAVDEQIKASLADIEAGRVVDARQAMRKIAADKGIKLDR